MSGSRPGTEDAVSVVIVGGLGNQLFGYALGLELSHRLQCPLRLLVGYLGERQLGLGDLPLPGHVTFGTELSERRGRVLRLLTNHYSRRNIWESGLFQFDPSILALKAPVTLRGYFQSWQYFPTVADDVRTQITDLREPSAAFQDLKAEIDGMGPFTAVQARRGDYLGNANICDVAGDAYFRRALALIDETHPLVIFTDDDDWQPAWCRTYHHRIICPRDLASPRENLVLMSLAQQFVISNSTFGWWGAFAGRKDARVIAPRPWWGPLDTRDLLPPSWATVDIRDLA